MKQGVAPYQGEIYKSPASVPLHKNGQKQLNSDIRKPTGKDGEDALFLLNAKIETIEADPNPQGNKGDDLFLNEKGTPTADKEETKTQGVLGKFS